MEHHHNHDCCGGDCSHHHHHCNCSPQPLTQEEEKLLSDLKSKENIPVVRFLLGSSKSSHFESVALAPVYMESPEASMEEVKATGELLKSLEEKGKIEIDYDNAFQKELYTVYNDSLVYKMFCQMVDEAKTREGFVFDLGQMECGNISIL